MTSILSSISGKFNYNFMVGTFAPVLVFILLARLLVVPLLPGAVELPLLEPIRTLGDTAWELLVLFLSTVVLSILVFSLNTSILRFYEGYPLEDTWLGQRKIRRYQRQWEALNNEKSAWTALQAALAKELEGLKQANPADERIAQLEEQIDDVRQRGNQAARVLLENFPRRSSLLPTRLGNAIRAFENYPQWQYGMAAITLYPRLVGVIKTDYAKLMDDAKAGLDFMIHSCTLIVFLIGLQLLAALAFPGSVSGLYKGLDFPPAPWFPWLQLLITLTLLGLTAAWLYRQSIDSAHNWGELVRGAFDLYRADLLKSLGYSYTFKTAEEERALWGAISRRLIFGDPPKGRGELPRYAPASGAACAVKDPSSAALELTRGFGPVQPDGSQTVVIEVRNTGSEPTAKDWAIIDMVPASYAFAFDTQSVDAGSVQVSGTNPYTFRPSRPLVSGETLRLVYRLLPQKQPPDSTA